MYQKAKNIALIIVLLLWACPAISFAQRGSIEEQILFYTNKYRKSKGKQPLVLSGVVSSQAAAHSRNMAKKKVGFGHGGFNTRSKTIGKQIGFISAAAENVAYGQLTGKEVVDGWIKSSGHRKNILGNFNTIGIGVAKARDGTIYFTQIFVHKD